MDEEGGGRAEVEVRIAEGLLVGEQPTAGDVGPCVKQQSDIQSRPGKGVFKVKVYHLLTFLSFREKVNNVQRLAS